MREVTFHQMVSQSDNLRTVSDPAVTGAAIDALVKTVVKEAARVKAQCPAARPALAPSIKPESRISQKPDWITRRFELLHAAIAFLRTHAIIVSPDDRQPLVRRYWVSGKRDPQFAEDVVGLAQAMGWELPR